LVDFGWIWGLAPYNNRVSLYIRVIMGHYESTTHNCFYFVGDWSLPSVIFDFWYRRKGSYAKNDGRNSIGMVLAEQISFCSEGTCGKSNPTDRENIYNHPPNLVKQTVWIRHQLFEHVFFWKFSGPLFSCLSLSVTYTSSIKLPDPKASKIQLMMSWVSFSFTLDMVNLSMEPMDLGPDFWDIRTSGP